MKITSFFIIFFIVIAFANSTVQAATSKSNETKPFTFQEAKTFLETKANELENSQKKLAANEFENIDQANEVLIKYEKPSVKYVLFSLTLEESLAKSSINGNKSALKDYCNKYKFITSSDDSFLSNSLDFKEKLSEKFIKKEDFQSFSEDELRKKIVDHVIALSILYGYRDPDSLKIRLDKVFSYKRSDGNYVATYLGMFNLKNGYGAYVGYKPFLAESYNGEVFEFKDLQEGSADQRVLNICK